MRGFIDQHGCTFCADLIVDLGNVVSPTHRIARRWVAASKELAEKAVMQPESLTARTSRDRSSTSISSK
ncbi:hypothetical protein PILCRDRAFT_822627 [Piloderma croceum F 1598]|uniref:Uncharacterized protein n=1 Tax=Piloderma croceum (strain F 1598) TaxID=765440 RepID=A0A0C3B1P8_PILCF|nr:hypothetical protein PILCRDRAFT_822627 [Piloderma croceum F 1598]